MENMEDFEGIKRIKNANNFSIEFIYNCLKQYEKAIGVVDFEENKIYSLDIFNNKKYVR